MLRLSFNLLLVLLRIFHRGPFLWKLGLSYLKNVSVRVVSLDKRARANVAAKRRRLFQSIVFIMYALGFPAGMMFHRALPWPLDLLCLKTS